MLNQNEFRNVFSCIFSFFIGIFFEKHQLYKKRSLQMIGLITFIVCYCAPLSKFMNFNLLCHLSGTSLFLTLYLLSHLLCKICKLTNICKKISAVSYEMFLIQHVVIIFACDHIHINSELYFALIFLLLTAIIYALAICVNKISKSSVKAVKLIANTEVYKRKY